MGLWTDNAVAASTGTSTTNTQINGAQSLATPTQAKVIKEVTPYSFALTAYTAAESNVQRFTASSTSIGTILPKAIALTPSHGGLGTFAGVQVPMLVAYRFDTRLPNANTPIDYFSQSFVANTAAFAVGATVAYSDMIPTQGQGVIPEQFYDCPTAMTAGGTAAANVTGNTILVNNAVALNMGYVNCSIQTVNASDSIAGFAQIDSTDLVTIQRIRFAAQPLGVGLGTAAEVLQPSNKFYPQALPLKTTATLNTSFTAEQAVAGNFRFEVGIGFVRAQ